MGSGMTDQQLEEWLNSCNDDEFIIYMDELGKTSIVTIGQFKEIS